MQEQDVELSFEDLTFGSDQDKDDESLEPKDELKHKNALFLFTSYGGKLNVVEVLKKAEQCGSLKSNNFRDKQCFGFIQYNTPEAVEKAIVDLNNVEVDGFKINVEKCVKITPGRDPRTHESKSEFKNFTLVLKNLPFQLKQERLEELLNALEWKPQSVSYLYDGTGMFRGMAFVKYKEIESATKVFDAINNMDINGRKLRVEYKRKVPEAEVEDNTQKLYEQLNSFKNNNTITEVAFPCGSSFQRKQIHQFAEKLGLVHFSTGEGETRYVLLKKKDNETTPIGIPSITSSSPSGTPPKAIKVHGNSNNSRGKASGSYEYRQRSSFDSRSMSPDEKNPLGSPEKFESKSSRSFQGTQGTFGSFKSPPQYTSSSLPTASPKYGNSTLVFNRILQEGPTITPQRQPKGPDGTNGFSDIYKKSRQNK